MAHTDIIKDSDKCFEIDPITRVIRNASPTKTTIIQFDHNSERFTFTLPRFIEGHDMMECNRVEVHYLNGATPGVYEVDDLKISAEDENKVTCSWLISQNATQYTGALHFLIRFSCVEADGTIKYVWNTDIFKGINVITGMFNSNIIVEQHADVLEQWKSIIDSLSTKSIVKTTTITLLASDWDSDSDNQHSQIVAIADVTPYSKIDLQPTVEQLAIFYEKDITFVTENDNGIITVYCIGQKPMNDYVMQATITEVEA